MRALLIRKFHSSLGLDAGVGGRLLRYGATIVRFAGWGQKREKEKKNHSELLGYNTVHTEWPLFLF